MIGLLKQFMIVIMIVGELWTTGASHAGDSFSLSLLVDKYSDKGVPLFTTCIQYSVHGIL